MSSHGNFTNFFQVDCEYSITCMALNFNDCSTPPRCEPHVDGNCRWRGVDWKFQWPFYWRRWVCVKSNKYSPGFWPICRPISSLFFHSPLFLSFFAWIYHPIPHCVAAGQSNGTRTAESEWNFLLLSIVECSTSRTQNYKGSSVGSLRLKFITMIGFFQLKKFQIYWISIQGCFLFILQGGGREWKTTKKGRKAERRKKRKKLKTTRWWRKIRDLKVNAVVDFSRCHEIGRKFLLLFFRLLLASLLFYNLRQS